MALILMLLRKMLKNRWLVASLLVGMVLSTALASSIPTYKNSILQKMLVKEMELYHVNSGRYPGTVQAYATFQRTENQNQILQKLEASWSGLFEGPKLTEGERVFDIESANISFDPVDSAKADPDQSRNASFLLLNEIEEHAELTSGRWPTEEPVGGVIEALVTDRTLTELDIVLGVELVTNTKEVAQPVTVVPVGVIREDDVNKLYWNNKRLTSYGNAFILPEATFMAQLFTPSRVTMHSAHWNVMVDYTKLDVAAAQRLRLKVQELDKYYKSIAGSIGGKVSLPVDATLALFDEREQRLRSLLWSLNIPMILLIAFYLFMVSSLLIERQKQEISVLRSRGAGRLQIGFFFGLESAFLALLAFLAGPWLGGWFTRVLGSSSTFMSFVQRKALVVEVGSESYLYAGIAALFAFIINLIPVMIATRFSIVDQKRNSARQTKRSLWHLLGIDVILLALAFYGLYTFRKRIQDLLTLGLDGADLSVDPLLFAVPTLFIFGFGLLMLRLYPWIVRLIYWMGRSRWSPSAYSSLLLVGRRGNLYHPLMLFLILTLGTGIFNASAARTLNSNMEDQIWYQSGADVVLQQVWQNDAPPDIPGGMGGESEAAAPDKINYKEPPFEMYEKVEGIEQAARVFIRDSAFARTTDNYNQVTLMGIRTDEFGEVAWMKSGLLPYHFYDYLNLIAPDPQAVLISRTMAQQYEIGPGDTIELAWEGTDQMMAIVYGVIDYFPTFNPNVSSSQASNQANRPAPMLVVGHLSMIQNSLAIEPYQVWVKLKEGADLKKFYDSLADNRLDMESIDNTMSKIIESRNDPFRMAINGVMSLGFILSLLISFIGFLLYWVLSMQSRLLQLGVFRAMGISFASMVGMLSVEQLLTSGAGMLIGLLSGAIASFIFVPMFQMSFDPGQIVPPFEVLVQAKDTTQLLLITAVMLTVALVVLGTLLKRMKIHQAVKLGED